MRIIDCARLVVTALALMLAAAPAQAELITLDLVPGSNDQLLTHDTETGLDWLAITQTINMTYDQVRTGIWYQMGFRHASEREVRTFFRHAGTPDDGFDISVTYPEETLALARRLGVTILTANRESTSGFVGTDFRGNLVTLSTHPIGQRFNALLGKVDYLDLTFAGLPLIGEAHFTQGHPFSDDTSPSFGSFLARPQTVELRHFFLHGVGATANPSVLTIDELSPMATSAKYKDSGSITFGGGNAWKEIGTWAADPGSTHWNLTELDSLQVWVGLKNTDDQGTRFDVRAEIYRANDLVASGLVRCLPGIIRNPASPVEVTIPFYPFELADFDGATDALMVRVLTRIGTNPDETKCPGHASATGLRLYFDAVDRAAQFGAVIP